MKVLIVGSGGREHALAWKLSAGRNLTELYAAPGNAGIANVATCVDIKANDIDGIKNFCLKEKIEYVVVGPEEPLCLGIVDALKEAGISAFGPSKAAAELEGSKVYAKHFMKKYSIPSAKYEVFSDREAALTGLSLFSLPVVIKADGLAQGKGVIIAKDEGEAKKAIDEIMLDKRFGAAGQSIVIEEFLTGIEASMLCFVDGKTILPLADCQDYKREYDGDKGENTGGMGSHSPGFAINHATMNDIKENILQPFLRGINKENLDYRGLAFIGLMIKEDKAKVIEFNVRFGDPETQSLVLRMDFDLLQAMIKTTERRLDELELKWKSEAAVTVVMASAGYPRDYEKGEVIEGLDQVEGAEVFHSASLIKDGKLLTNGGRVLALSAAGADLEAAREKAYREISKINFKGAKMRTDIAERRKV